MADGSQASLGTRVVAWLSADRKRRWWVLVLFCAAFFVRLRWNLVVHPLDQFLYSDMKGYLGRANGVLDNPFSVREYDAFFPFGTTWMLAGIKYVFGRDNIAAIAVIYAFYGAVIVAASHAIADRVIGDRAAWVGPAVGLFLVMYYPLIAVGGYVLSEVPFSVCLTLAVLLLLRVVDEGRPRDAWFLGLVLGVGMLIRPQLLLSMALIAGFWLILRFRPGNPYEKLGWGHLVRMGVPVVLLLTMASIRLYVHTGRLGLVSENSDINLVFGRCHNKGIYSRPDGQGHGTVRFSPPPLIQLEAYSERNPDSWIKSKSVWGDHPEPVETIPGFAIDAYGCTRRACRQPGSEIEYRGYIGDREIHKDLVRTCIERGGLSRQAYFTLTHWMLLWRYNLMWPDHANPRPRSTKPRETWRHRQEVWARVHRGALMVPALLGLGFAFVPRRRPKHALIALNFMALLIVAGVWFGDARMRTAYDPIITMLAVIVYAEVWLWARERWRRRRG